MDWCRTGSDSDQIVVVKREESMKANLSICHQLCAVIEKTSFWIPAVKMIFLQMVEALL